MAQRWVLQDWYEQTENYSPQNTTRVGRATAFQSPVSDEMKLFMVNWAEPIE